MTHQTVSPDLLQILSIRPDVDAFSVSRLLGADAAVDHLMRQFEARDSIPKGFDQYPLVKAAMSWAAQLDAAPSPEDLVDAMTIQASSDPGVEAVLQQLNRAGHGERSSALRAWHAAVVQAGRNSATSHAAGSIAGGSSIQPAMATVIAWLRSPLNLAAVIGFVVFMAAAHFVGLTDNDAGPVAPSPITAAPAPTTLPAGLPGAEFVRDIPSGDDVAPSAPPPPDLQGLIAPSP